MNTSYAALDPRVRSHAAPTSTVHNGQPTQYTVTALKRWSCSNQPLPPVQNVSVIHIYDFDNTLFASPLPNVLIWDPKTASKLQGVNPFVNGGWWHEPGILSSTGEGVEKEEPRAWEGWWNEEVVNSVRSSWANSNTISVLLTGRSESGFADLLQRMVRSKGLHFHMICLKPKILPTNVAVTSTLQFKTELFKSLICTYSLATRMQIWEDRQHHVQKFNTFLNRFNQEMRQMRSYGRTTGIVHQVNFISGLVRPLDHVAEISAIQRTINAHNRAVLDGAAPGFTAQKIAPYVAYTAYHFANQDARKTFVRLANPPRHADIILQPSHVLLNTSAIPAEAIADLGGVGAVAPFKTTHFGSHGGNIWAVRVECTDAALSKKIAQVCNVPTLHVLVARRKFTSVRAVDKINQWHKIPQKAQFTFQAQLGERLFLEIVEEEEEASDSEQEAIVPHPTVQSMAGQKRVYQEISSSSEGEIEETEEYLALNFGGEALLQQEPKAHKQQKRGGGTNKGRVPSGPRGKAPTAPARSGYDNHRGRGAPPAARGRGGRGAAHAGRKGGKHKNQYQDLDQNGGLGAGGASGGFDY